MNVLKKIKSFFYLNIGGEHKEIYPFYAFRFLFFVAIFVHHSFNLVKVDFLRQPTMAVSGFIILSGFLNGYIYLNKYKVNLKEIYSFTIKRIKKFYLLHVVMLFVSISYSGVFNYSKASEFVPFLKKLLANLTLTQSWINNKDIYFSFNGVTWFLSTYLFLTLITIPLLFIIKKVKDSKYGKMKLILLSLILFITTFIIVYYVSTNNLNREFWIYVFPPSRAIEYFIGMAIGSLIPKTIKKFKYDKITFTIFEITSMLLLVIEIMYVKNSLILNARMNMYLIPLLLMFCIFSYQKGHVSLLLSNKMAVYLGKVSMYMFIIHQPLIRLLSHNVVHYRYLALYIFILTIIISCLIEKIYKKSN